MLPLKKEARRLLKEKDYGKIASLSPSHHKIINTLITLSYDKTDVISWRAIEAIGTISKTIAESDPDTVRNISGRLLWMIRDESGGIGWSAPEILGEIVRNNPGLCADLAPVIASFHEEKMLTAGVLWAMGRIGKINDETAAYAIPHILPYLNSSDKTLRGYAAFALGAIGAIGAVPKLEQLKDDDNEVFFYEDGELKKKSVGKIAEEALSILKST